MCTPHRAVDLFHCSVFLHTIFFQMIWKFGIFSRNMSEKPKLAPGVYLVMEENGEALFMKRPDTSYQAGSYMLPGGGVEQGEPPSAAIARETFEELGIEINSKDLELIHLMCRGAHDDTGDRLDIFYRITKWVGEPKIMEPDKCVEFKRLDLDNLPESVPMYVRSALENYRNNIIYSELDY